MYVFGFISVCISPLYLIRLNLTLTNMYQDGGQPWLLVCYILATGYFVCWFPITIWFYFIAVDKDTVNDFHLHFNKIIQLTTYPITLFFSLTSYAPYSSLRFWIVNWSIVFIYVRLVIFLKSLLFDKE